MPGNPAQVDRVTGDLFIDPYSWENMTESMRRFILLHEEGHLKGGADGGPTSNELEADLYAFRQYKHTEPGSLKKSVIALDLVLGNSPDQIKRKLMIYSAALLEDWQVNKNPKALVEYHNIRGELIKYHDVELPVVDSDKSNFVVIASAIIGAVVTGVKMYSSSQAKKNAESEQNAYNTAAETQYVNQYLQSIYAGEAQKDAAQEKAINMKYLMVIGVVLFISMLVYWYYFKRK